MEYGEALTADAFDRAVGIARKLIEEGMEGPGPAASEAVARAYCVCVTDGEDAAEGRFSDLHRNLIDAVSERLSPNPPLRANAQQRNEPWH